MSTWPSTLPRSPRDAGYREQLQDNVVTSAMDTGPAKMRRRFTARSTFCTVQYLLTTAQLATLSTFFESTLLDGSVSFDWPHPRLGTTVTARFQGPIDITSASGDYVYVSASIEILP